MNYHPGDDQGDEVGDNPKVDWENRVAEIIGLLSENPKISITKLASRTGLTKRQIERSIDHLKEEGRLGRDGSARNGNWIVLKK